MENIDIFDGYKILKYRNSDPVRDVTFLIDIIKGVTYKELSQIYGISRSEVSRRANNILRKVRGFLIRKNEEKYYPIFWGNDNEKIIELLFLYKIYCIKSMEKGDLYRHFKKDIIKEKKQKRIKCMHCNGNGYL